MAIITQIYDGSIGMKKNSGQKMRRRAPDGRHAPHAAAKGGLRVSVFDPRAARPSQSCAAQGVGVREMRAVSAEEGRYGCIQKDDGE